MKLLRPVMTASAGVLLLSLAACGGGNDSTATAAATTGQQGQQAGQTGQAGQQPGGRFPGANGLIADISGKTLQVQSQSAQTAVTYSDKTTFTAQVAAKLADVKVGSCVQASPAQDSTTGTDSTTAPTAVTAATVRITPAASDGSCTRGGFGGRAPGAGAPSGMPTDLPSDLPTGRPSRAPSGGRGGFGGFGAFGKVTAVSATGFTVEQEAFTQDGQSGQTTDVTVTVTADTTYTTTQSSTARALAVGKCVSANGQTDDTGSVAAERITISDAVDGQCTGGFGGFGGRPGGAQ